MIIIILTIEAGCCCCSCTAFSFFTKLCDVVVALNGSNSAYTNIQKKMNSLSFFLSYFNSNFSIGNSSYLSLQWRLFGFNYNNFLISSAPLFSPYDVIYLFLFGLLSVKLELRNNGANFIVIYFFFMHCMKCSAKLFVHFWIWKILQFQSQV